MLRDGDSLYHLRRVQQTIASGRVPAFDPQLAFPNGQLVPWPPGYDLGLAGWVVAFCGTSPSQRCSTTAAVVSTPIAGVIATLLLLLLGRSLLGGWPGLLAAALFAAYPFAVVASLIGAVDHHALEPLAVAGWFLALARGRPLMAGTIAGAGFGVFPTALLPVAVTSGALSALGIWRPEISSHPRGALLFTLAATTIASAAVLASPFRDSWALVSPSRLHLLVMATLSLASGAVLLCSRRWPGHRWLAVGCCGAIGIAATAVAWPALPSMLQLATGGGLWQEILQHQPVATSWLGAGLLAIILTGACLFAFGRAARSGEALMAVVAFCAWLLGLAGLAQMRFLMVASPLLVLVIADVLLRAPGWFRQRQTPRWLRRAATGALVVIASLPLADYLRTRTPDPATVDVVRLLRRLGQQHQGPRNVSVLADWQWGHHILYYARLPTVASPFVFSGHDPPNLLARRALLANNPDELVEVMRRRRSRYVLSKERKALRDPRLELADREPHLMLYRLFLDADQPNNNE